jgi:hypothetical protein
VLQRRFLGFARLRHLVCRNGDLSAPLNLSTNSVTFFFLIFTFSRLSPRNTGGTGAGGGFVFDVCGISVSRLMVRARLRWRANAS